MLRYDCGKYDRPVKSSLDSLQSSLPPTGSPSGTTQRSLLNYLSVQSVWVTRSQHHWRRPLEPRTVTSWTKFRRFDGVCTHLGHLILEWHQSLSFVPDFSVLQYFYLLLVRGEVVVRNRSSVVFWNRVTNCESVTTRGERFCLGLTFFQDSDVYLRILMTVSCT